MYLNDCESFDLWITWLSPSAVFIQRSWTCPCISRRDQRDKKENRGLSKWLGGLRGLLSSQTNWVWSLRLTLGLLKVGLWLLHMCPHTIYIKKCHFKREGKMANFQLFLVLNAAGVILLNPLHQKNLEQKMHHLILLSPECYFLSYVTQSKLLN